MTFIDNFIDLACRLFKVLLVVLLAIMVVMVFGNVVLRYGFNSGIAVSEELSRWMFLWVIFLGAAIAVREKAHMGSDMLVEHLPPAAQKAVVVLGQVLMLWVTWLMFTGSLAQTRINWEVEAPVTGASMAWVYTTGVVFAVFTGLMLLSELVHTLRGQLTPQQLIAAHHAAERAEAEDEAGVIDHSRGGDSSTPR